LHCAIGPGADRSCLLDQSEQPGPRTCRWSGDPIIAGVEQYTFTLDQRTGNARLDAVLIPLDPAAPKPTVEATWRGGRPIGIHLVETTRFDELATGRTTTTLGVRWPRADAAVTYDGVAKPVDRPSVTAYRQRQEPATG
jgi:hypothetical protein